MIGMAVNVDQGKIAVSKNGSWSNIPDEEDCGVVITDEKIKQGVFPCLTAGRYSLKYAFKDFKYAAPPADLWDK